MKIEATVKDIRALLEIAELDRGDDRAPSETQGQRRKVAARRVPSRLLDRYQSLLEAGRTPVVVAIDRGVCSGCHMRLPTMVECIARSLPAVHTCPHCRRMLYAPELLPSLAGDGQPSRGAAAARPL